MKNNILNSKKTKHIILIILSTIYLLASIKSVFFVAFGVHFSDILLAIDCMWLFFKVLLIGILLL